MLASNCHLLFIYTLSENNINVRRVGIRKTGLKTLTVCCPYFLENSL
ncbi:hypothetical protein EC840_101103 [Rahnella sp. JUb53]|nr:hypothetical protein EC840_101103 [Rahnella sp. JUb53]